MDKTQQSEWTVKLDDVNNARKRLCAHAKRADVSVEDLIVAYVLDGMLRSEDAIVGGPFRFPFSPSGETMIMTSAPSMRREDGLAVSEILSGVGDV